MRCIKCGLNKRGNTDFYICDPCKEFSKLVDTVYSDIEENLTTMRTIDPETTPIFRLLADSSFVTAQNPQTRIFYKLCEFFVESAIEEKYQISEYGLNKAIPTTRSWSDALKVFEELGLIKVETEKYTRNIVLKDKIIKFGEQFFSDKPKTKQLTDRLSHIYSGYVLFYILSIIARMNIDSAQNGLPYNQKPRTLWITLMYLWNRVYEKHKTFSEEDMRKFMGRRRIPSSSRGEIIRALQNIDGRTVQGLIKDWSYHGRDLVFHFDDYVLLEMERMREIRERSR